MSSFFVDNITWEYGKKYGHVFYPKNMQELQDKIQELHTVFEQKQQPSLIAMLFTVPIFYLGFSIGYELSYMEFSFRYDQKYKSWTHPHYLKNDLYSEDDFIPISYFASESYTPKTHFFPYEEVLNGIFNFIENRKFPKKLVWDDLKDMQPFIAED